MVVLNGIFVASEFAFVKIRATQVDRLVREGRASSSIVKEATGKLDAYLAVCQLGITISSLGLGWIGEPAFHHLLEPVFQRLALPDSTASFVAFAVAFGTISFLHVVFGELAPKTIAIQSPENTSLFVAPFMKFFYYLLLPGTLLFNGTANLFTRMLGYRPASETDESHSEDEIRTLVTQSRQHGMLDREEEEMIESVFELNDKMAREIMVPRPDVVSLPANAGLEHLISVAAAGNYTRYPIFEEEDPDRIIGAIHVKDLLRIIQDEGLESDVTARNIMREVLTVPENRLIDDILEDFQEQEIQMAIVIDEWGSFEGLFTVEDIIEEIVGEIRDEFDEEEPSVRELDHGAYAIDGRLPLGVVNDALDTEFESDDFETIGGLVLGLLGRPPDVGDEVRADGHVLLVDETDGPRVAQVIVRQSEEKSEQEENSEKESRTERDSGKE
ncbi:MAG: hemolysin family protein [Actinomycetota bacterium]|nr:hemolysin family protein [Actinomycetota bacterium]